jgi:hypothetical protein
MPVKYWSAAGLVLSYWCNARCESCYLGCGDEHAEWMSAADAIDWWGQLASACPHGCRTHLTGGEPFGNWPLLIEVARLAAAEGLAPLEKVETNAFWATDDRLIRDRLAALDAAGMRKLTISADPYHQQFVPMDHCRRLARIAEETLGPSRVQVRWRDWLAEGCDVSALAPEQREDLFRRYSADGRDRLTGRACGMPARWRERKTPAQLADKDCREPLLRSRHVHVDPAGRVMPGTCAGIVLGTLGARTVREIWQGLNSPRLRGPVLACLVERGPAGLLDAARERGLATADGYADKCSMCWQLRSHLAREGVCGEELAPRWLYDADAPDGAQGPART